MQRKRILSQVESLLLHLHRRLDHSGEVPGRHQAPLQAGQQRQEVRVLHRALRPSCHPPQLLKDRPEQGQDQGRDDPPHHGNPQGPRSRPGRQFK